MPSNERNLSLSQLGSSIIPMILAAFLVGLTLLLFVITFHMATLVVLPRTFSPEKLYQLLVQKGKLDEERFNLLRKQEVYIPSTNGYSLYGIYFPYNSSKRTVIMVHGITYNLYGMIEYVPLFHELGYNVLVFDLRNHGRSGGHNTTFGYYEKTDLKAVTDWVLQRSQGNRMAGTFGISLGAAIALQHGAVDQRISFIIADSSFSDLYALIRIRLKKDAHLPAFPFLPIMNFFAHAITGMHFQDASPIRAIPTISCPVLFIHGKNDNYIPPQMTLDLYEAKTQGKRMLYLAPGANHAEAYWQDRIEYKKQIETFLNQV